MIKRSNHTFSRIFLYVFTLVLHAANKNVIDARYNEISDDPEIKAYYPLRNRFFTGWIVFLHMVYSIIGLICEGLKLRYACRGEVPKRLKEFRDFLFCVFIWPSTWVVFLVFWTVYYYNRHLVCPVFVDKLVSSNSNHIMHTFILPFVLLELYFEPRTAVSHKRNITYMSIFYWSYYAMSMYTYKEYGVWLYPIYGVLYGTVYFPMIPITVYIIILTAYFAQWTFTSALEEKAKQTSEPLPSSSKERRIKTE